MLRGIEDGPKPAEALSEEPTDLMRSTTSTFDIVCEAIQKLKVTSQVPDPLLSPSPPTQKSKDKVALDRMNSNHEAEKDNEKKVDYATPKSVALSHIRGKLDDLASSRTSLFLDTSTISDERYENATIRTDVTFTPGSQRKQIGNKSLGKKILKATFSLPGAQLKSLVTGKKQLTSTQSNNITGCQLDFFSDLKSNRFNFTDIDTFDTLYSLTRYASNPYRSSCRPKISRSRSGTRRLENEA